MKTRYVLALAILSGLGAAAAVHGLHAQTKPPVYYVAELEVLNKEALRQWGERVEASIKAAGGQYLVRGTDIVGLEGVPPKQMVILAWDSMDKLRAWYDGPYKEIRPLRDMAHKSVRSYAVVGVLN
jgi:uncharacterized protein (DUF1330 family)